MSATAKWIATAVDIVDYELTCPPGELMSEACDRLIERYPIAGRAVIVGIGAAIIAHLANLHVDERWDPISQTFWREVKQWRK